MNEQKNNFLFSKTNYILMAVGVALVVLGFILMAGGGSSDPNSFNPEVYGFQRITLAPLLIIIGFIVEFIAIFKK